MFIIYARGGWGMKLECYKFRYWPCGCRQFNTMQSVAHIIWEGLEEGDAVAPPSRPTLITTQSLAKNGVGGIHFFPLSIALPLPEIPLRQSLGVDQLRHSLASSPIIFHRQIPFWSRKYPHLKLGIARLVMHHRSLCRSWFLSYTSQKFTLNEAYLHIIMPNYPVSKLSICYI